MLILNIHLHIFYILTTLERPNRSRSADPLKGTGLVKSPARSESLIGQKQGPTTTFGKGFKLSNYTNVTNVVVN